MIAALKSLIGRQVFASDGLAGTIVDFHFNQRSWKICRLFITGEACPSADQGIIIPSDIESIRETGDAAVRVVRATEYLGHERECDASAKHNAGTAIPESACLSSGNAAAFTGYESDRFTRTDSRDPRLSDAVFHTRSMSQLLGRSVIADGECIGICIDALLDTVDWRIGSLVISLDGDDHDAVLVDVATVESVDADMRSILLHLSAPDLRRQTVCDPASRMNGTVSSLPAQMEKDATQ